MKSYIYHGADDTRIDDFEEEGCITLTKLAPEKLEAAKMIVRKHSILIGDTVIQKSKSTNYLKTVRKNIIKEGLKVGTCEAM